MGSDIEVKECFERFREGIGFTRIVYRDKAGHIFTYNRLNQLTSECHNQFGIRVKEFSKRPKEVV